MMQSPKMEGYLTPLAVMAILWVGPSLLLYLLSYTSIGKMFDSQLLSFLLLGFFVFLLSTIMAIFFKFERSYLVHNNILRRNLIILLLVLRVLVFPLENGENAFSVLAGVTGTTLLILLSCLVGSYLCQAINRPAELIPVCSVAFMVDFYSVLQGPSKVIAQQVGDFYSKGAKGPVPLADMILLKIPNPAVEFLTPVFGVSDWIFIVFLSAVLLKFKISDSVIAKDIYHVVNSTQVQLYFPLASLALLVSVLIAYLLGSFVPALPIILTMVLPWLIFTNRGLFIMRRSDYILTAIPPILIFILFLWN